jgi:two-component system nitrate/nitrite response regulator NarL
MQEWPRSARPNVLRRRVDSVLKRILIADDTPAIRACLRCFLEQQPDWEICGEAVDGLDALRKARDLHPDLVVLDLSMPVMNGLEAARRLHELRPLLPVILFTSHSTPFLEKEAAAAGIPDVVSKDRSLIFLAAAIRKLFGSIDVH